MNLSGLLMGSFSIQTLKKKHEQRGENSEIGRQVRRETPVLAGVTETTAGDIESTNFRRDRRERENRNKCNQD